MVVVLYSIHNILILIIMAATEKKMVMGMRVVGGKMRLVPVDGGGRRLVDPPGPPTINNMLSLELLTVVLSYLDADSLGQAMGVCQLWLAAFTGLLRRRVAIQFSNLSDSIPEYIGVFRRYLGRRNKTTEYVLRSRTTHLIPPCVYREISNVVRHEINITGILSLYTTSAEWIGPVLKMTAHFGKTLRELKVHSYANTDSPERLGTMLLPIPSACVKLEVVDIYLPAHFSNGLLCEFTRHCRKLVDVRIGVYVGGSCTDVEPSGRELEEFCHAYRTTLKTFDVDVSGRCRQKEAEAAGSTLLANMEALETYKLTYRVHEGTRSYFDNVGIRHGLVCLFMPRNVPRLKLLDLRGYHHTMVAEPLEYPALETLRLYQITYEAWRFGVHVTPKLAEIEIVDNQKMTDEHFKSVQRWCPGLRRLALIDCERVTVEVIVDGLLNDAWPNMRRIQLWSNLSVERAGVVLLVSAVTTKELPVHVTWVGNTRMPGFDTHNQGWRFVFSRDMPKPLLPPWDRWAEVI